MHALIIEDQLIFASIIEYVLRDCGFDSFHVAASKEAAVAAARSRRPDLITADVMLETGSGLEAIHAIDTTSSPIPVIFITGSAAEIRDQIPGHAVLNKPFTEQTLAYAVAASMAQTPYPAKRLA